MSVNYWTLFKDKNYVRFYLAESLSNIGSKMSVIALPLYVYFITHSAVDIGIAFAIETAPWIIFGTICGHISDHYNRKTIMIICDVSRAILLITIAFISKIFPIYFILFLLGFFNTLFTSARAAALPMVIGKDSYVKAVALSSVTSGVVSIAGPSLAALLLLFMEPRSLFLFDGGTFLLSSALISSINIPKILKSLAKHPQNIKKIMITGFNFIRNNFRISCVLQLDVIKSLIEGISIPLCVILIVEEYEYSKQFFALFMAAMSSGAALGALAVGKIHKISSRFKSSIFALLLISFSYLGVAMFKLKLLLLLFWFLGGVGVGMTSVLTNTVIALESDDNVRGRVVGTANTLLCIAYVIGQASSGNLSNWLGVRAVYLICFAVLLFYAPQLIRNIISVIKSEENDE